MYKSKPVTIPTDGKTLEGRRVTGPKMDVVTYGTEGDLVAAALNRCAVPAPAEPSSDLIYLATPYSHSDLSVRIYRFERAAEIASRLMSRGLCVFSPITHTHPIAVRGGLPTGWEFWQRYDRAMLAACSRLMVVKMDGWEQSKGIAAEIEIAKEMGKPVEYLELDDPRLTDDPLPDPKAQREAETPQYDPRPEPFVFLGRDGDLDLYFRPRVPPPDADDASIFIVRGDRDSRWWAHLIGEGTPIPFRVGLARAKVKGLYRD